MMNLRFSMHISLDIIYQTILEPIIHKDKFAAISYLKKVQDSAEFTVDLIYRLGVKGAMVTLLQYVSCCDVLYLVALATSHPKPTGA